MTPITARFCWTVDDLFIGRKYATKSGIFGLPLISAIAVICCWILLRGAPRGRVYSLNTNLAIIGIFAVAVIGGGTALFLTRKIELVFARRKFARRPDANAEVEWKFSDEEITTSTDNSKSEMKWTAFHKVIATPKGLIFMPCAEIFHFIPIRAFQSSGDMETVMELARRQVAHFKILK